MDADRYIERVIRVLYEKPTAGDLDFLVEAFAVVGNLAAEAEGLAEKATNHRKHMEAVAYLQAKKATPRPTDTEAKALALTETIVEHHAEADANANARMIRNLLEAIEQAINAIKFLGRLT